MAKTLDELDEWIRLLRKENHPLADTLQEIAEGWRADVNKECPGMSENVEILNMGDPRFARLTSEIIEKIENDLPDHTLVGSVIRMLEIIKQHYVSRGVDKGEQG